MTNRREKGAGSLYYDEERDRWRGEVTIDGKRHRVTAKTKTEARRALRVLTAKRDTGQTIESSTKTVADAVAEFRRTLPNRTANGRPASSFITGVALPVDGGYLISESMAPT